MCKIHVQCHCSLLRGSLPEEANCTIQPPTVGPVSTLSTQLLAASKSKTNTSITRSSQVVSHSSTALANCCLTLVVKKCSQYQLTNWLISQQKINFSITWAGISCRKRTWWLQCTQTTHLFRPKDNVFNVHSLSGIWVQIQGSSPQKFASQKFLTDAVSDALERKVFIPFDRNSREM